MNQMYVSVVATRRKTNTVRRTVHSFPVGFCGPQRTIEHFASNLANTLTGDWVLNVMQITTHEYHAFRNQLNTTEATKL